jgi:hypothetical protein
MDTFQKAALAVVILIWILIAWEILVPRRFKETFTNYVSPVSIKSFYGQLVPARGDVGEELEEEGYRADPRYYHGYNEVQRLGLNKDYCRMVEPVNGDSGDAFFACALAGTEGLSSTAFRTKSVKNGFRRSRDDYMRDIAGEGRAGYCAILKETGNGWAPRCYRAYDTGFAETAVIDMNPPDEIKTLLSFYDGALMWYRMRDDIVDYAQNTTVSVAGRMTISEKPAPVTEGLAFNGIDQFIRVGDAGNKDIALTETVPMRFARTFSMWVRFDEFTNNTHIFDFGNGAGRDNVFLGIIGRGNVGAGGGEAMLDVDATAAIEASASCAREVPEGRPGEYKCMLPDAMGSTLPVVKREEPAEQEEAKTASLLYEVWDGGQRVMRIIVPDGIQRKKWTHIVVTTLDADPYRPNIAVYIDGVRRHVEKGGFLPQRSYLTHNYIGKSNWATDTSGSVDNDELFHGSLFDFRVLKKGLSEAMIKKTFTWGAELLGLTSS